MVPLQSQYMYNNLARQSLYGKNLGPEMAGKFTQKREKVLKFPVNFHGVINRDITPIQMSDLTSVYYIVFGVGDQRAANSRFARGREREMIYFR
jgi:hypothetical protein